MVTATSTSIPLRAQEAAWKPGLPRTASQEPRHISPTPQMLHNSPTPRATETQHRRSLQVCFRSQQNPPAAQLPAGTFPLSKGRQSPRRRSVEDSGTLPQRSPADAWGRGLSRANAYLPFPQGTQDTAPATPALNPQQRGSGTSPGVL